MPNQEDHFTITVKIFGRELKLPVRRSDEQYFREAVKLIESTYNNYTKRYSSTDNNFGIETYLKLVALDFGVRLKKMTAANDELKRKLEELEKDIDQHLD